MTTNVALAFVVVVTSLGCGCAREAPPLPAVASRAEPTAASKAELLGASRASGEAAVARRDEKAPCSGAVEVYHGAIGVDGVAYQHTVKRGGDYVDVEVPGLDRVVSNSRRLRFTLDYPFEKPFAGTVESDAGITLRRIIDSIRAAYRKMYAGTVQRDIPGLLNKDVSGPYGRAFHAIGDLVIEAIQLCPDGTLEIGIGS